MLSKLGHSFTTPERFQPPALAHHLYPHQERAAAAVPCGFVVNSSTALYYGKKVWSGVAATGALLTLSFAVESRPSLPDLSWESLGL